MKTLGICFGASTIQAVILQSDSNFISIENSIRIDHEGDPKKAFYSLVESLNICNIDKVAVTGRTFRKSLILSSIVETEAVEKAILAEYSNAVRFPQLVVSSGGETQLVYRIGNDGRILSVHTGNKCASGTGEFFLQQIRRMNLSIEEAVNLAQNGNAIKVAGRCSVFCKSDCTHALNKGVSVADVVAGLCVMMADKIDELIKDVPSDYIAVVGGSSQNHAMITALRKHHRNVDIPQTASCFEAYGTALWAFENHCVEFPKDINLCFIPQKLEQSFHKPLNQRKSKVIFKEMKNLPLENGDDCILGLDVGSTTTKAVLLRKSDNAFCAKVYLRTNGNPIEASRDCYRAIAEQISGIDIRISGLGVTGSGRQIAGLHALSDTIINEIIAHATAATHFDPDVDTLFEIGGQDAKYTFLSAGVPADYAMNEACSAGTGSFLEESAKEMLGVSMEQISTMAFKAESPPDFTDQCAAFIASDIKRASQNGIGRNDILAGLVYSICLNYLNRVRGNRPVGRKIFMQGGVCYNHAVPVAMASLLNAEIIVPPEPGLMGAFGVALEVKKRIESRVVKDKIFDLDELINRPVTKESDFICAGGSDKCDRKCSISRFRIGDKIYPFGGACDRYYNLRLNKQVNSIESLDLVALRQKLLIDVYGPDKNVHAKKNQTIGLNRALLFHTLYPLFSNFFSRLGYTIVISGDEVSEGMSRTEAAFCLPVEFAHGTFVDLLKKRCDYIFMPQVMQIPVPNVPTYSRLCPFIQGEPYYMKTTFRNDIKASSTVMLTPVLKMGASYSEALDVMTKVVVNMGVSKNDAHQAWDYACKKQIAFESELKRHGKKALYMLEKDPSKFGIVLFGRPYNTFASDINMSIPHKIASRGFLAIPLDMLSFEEYPVDSKMFWAMGQKIMKAGQFVKKRSNLFGCYVTNFSCGPDSFLLTYFRDTMKDKPALTLELDQHTADAGLDTRIEAALDIMSMEYISNIEKKHDTSFVPARVELPYVYDSEGNCLPITDDNVEVLLPPFGAMATEAVAAILRGRGINAHALPNLNRDGLLLGRKNTLCKECLPYIVTTGAFLTHLQKKRDPKLVTVFMMATGGGPCRLGQYFRAFEHTIIRKKMHNVAMLTITDENGYGGLGATTLLKAWQGVVLSDVFSDVRSMLRVAGADPESASKKVDYLWGKAVSYFEDKTSLGFSLVLKSIAKQLSQIPLKTAITDIPVISMVGEIYVRRDEFSRKDIVEYLESRGFMVRVAPMGEYPFYGNYVVNKGLGERKFTLLQMIKMKLTSKVQEWWEKRIKKIIAGSGLYHYDLIEVDKTIEGVQHLVNENFRGEAILTVGLAMREIINDSCGVISIGPFGCMYSRIAESILKKEMTIAGKARMAGWQDRVSHYDDFENLPFLSVETDGNPYPQLIEAGLESFILQAKRLHLRIMNEREK